MGRKAWFFEIDSIDPNFVENEWKYMCSQDQEKQKHYTLQLIQEEDWDMDTIMKDPLGLDKLINETAHYNESPLSFNECIYEWRELNEPSKEKIMAEILKLHKKWEAAIAVKFQGKTIIGGWVAT
jgi:hypothetical protein